MLPFRGHDYSKDSIKAFIDDVLGGGGTFE
jgi:hypothetical protein